MLKGLLKEEEEEEKRRERKKWKEQSKNKIALHTYLSMITLNVSGLIASSIRCRVAEWIGKQDHIYAASRELSQIKRFTQTKSQGMEKDISCKWKGKKAGVAVLISDKIDFETKAIIRNEEGRYIIIKGTVQQEE